MLPLVLGQATRLAQFYTRSDKIYEGVVRFGWATDTYDRAGEPTGEKREVDARPPRNWSRYWSAFAASFWQTPPPVSAKKVDGKRAYELARQSVAVELEPVKVQVYELTLLEVDGRWRATARALLRRHLHALHRARSGAGAGLRRAPGANCAAPASGEFEIGQARTIAQLESLAAE